MKEICFRLTALNVAHLSNHKHIVEVISREMSRRGIQDGSKIEVDDPNEFLKNNLGLDEIELLTPSQSIKLMKKDKQGNEK